MTTRNSWSLAAAFVLSLCMAPPLPGQDKPSPFQSSDRKPGQDQVLASELNSSLNQQAGKSGNSSPEQPRQNSAKPGNSDSNQGQQKTNVRQVQNQQRDSGSAPFNENKDYWYRRVWSTSGHQNELMRWSAYAPMPPIALAPVDDSLRVNLGLPQGQGLVVTAVEANSSAAEAGIQQNDILLKLGESGISNVESFFNDLKAIGEKPVKLTLLRDGKVQTIAVQPKIEVTLRPVMAPAQPSREFWIGVSVTFVDPALCAQLGLAAGGLVVSGVSDDSPAQKAGIQLYDILLDVDGEPLTDLVQLVKHVQAKGEKPIVLHLIRKGNDRMTLTVTPARKPATDSAAVQLPDPTYYTVIQPGGVVYDPWKIGGPVLTTPNQGNLLVAPLNPYYSAYNNVYPNNWQVDPNQFQPFPAGQAAGAPDPSSSMAKRLDALDAAIKELRKAVVESNQIAKTTEDMNKSLAASIEALMKTRN